MSNGWLIKLFFNFCDRWKIAIYGHCTSWMMYRYTIKQFYSFCEKTHCINLFVSISNQQCASSQFLFWMLQPCFVLKSRPQKKQKNFSSFPLSSRLFSIIVSRFGLLAVGLCSSGQQQSLHFHDFYPKWGIKCHPKCIASNNSKPKWIQKYKYFTDYVCKCNPNWPAWKVQSRNRCNTNSFSRSHKWW